MYLVGALKITLAVMLLAGIWFQGLVPGGAGRVPGGGVAGGSGTCEGGRTCACCMACCTRWVMSRVRCSSSPTPLASNCRKNARRSTEGVPPGAESEAGAELGTEPGSEPGAAPGTDLEPGAGVTPGVGAGVCELCMGEVKGWLQGSDELSYHPGWPSLRG